MNETEKKPSFRERVGKYVPWIAGVITIVGGVVAAICALTGGKETELTEIPSERSLDTAATSESNDLERQAREYTAPTEPFWVELHVRKLPEGMHPSPEKVAEMVEIGIEPTDGITVVDSYIKYES